MSPLRFLERSANVFPDRTAIVYGGAVTPTPSSPTRRSVWRGFWRPRSSRGPGGVSGSNIPEMLIAHFAVPLAGGVLVALNSRLAGAELAYILNHSGVAILVADSEFHATVAAIADVIPSLHGRRVDDPEFGTPAGPDEIEGLVSCTDFLKGADDLPARPWTVDDENAVITINYTSGTTGKPKGVMYTHRGRT